MKNMKTKLLVAVAMLIVASVMMTTATYAWFTISTQPEIADISAEICSNGNLEIQLVDMKVDATNNTYSQVNKAAVASAVKDAGKNETWGNLIDLESAFQATSGTYSVRLRPVLATVPTVGTDTDKTLSAMYMTFQYPTFGIDGRIKDTTDLTATTVADGSKNNFKDNGGVIFYKDGTGTTANTWCFEVDYWIRTNTVDSTTNVAKISLLAPSTTAGALDRTNPTTSEAGLGSYIKYSATPEDKDIVTIKMIELAVGTDGLPVAKGGKVHSVQINTLDTNNQGTLSFTSGDEIVLKEDEVKLIRMYVYMDGADLTNADFSNAVSHFDLNVQFTSDQKLKDMDVTTSDYNRDSANTKS